MMGLRFALISKARYFLLRGWVPQQLYQMPWPQQFNAI
jgi:hypothetical protein